MTKNRNKIFVLAAAFVILLICYFAIVRPLINAAEDSTETPPELVQGEVLGSNNRIMLFDHIEKANMQSIEVHNASGSWTMYRGDDNEFYLKGYEGAPYSKTLLASLVSDAGYTLSMTRVTENCEDFSIYGLAESDNPAWYTLTTISGEQHTVYIGNMIPTGAGYYTRYKDRDCVYVLQSSLKATLLASAEELITPILTYPLSSNDFYTVTNFYIAHGDDVMVSITYLDEEQRAKLAMDSAYLMIYPTSYAVSATYDSVLEVFTNFVADKTILLGGNDETIPAETLAKYGLDKPAHEIYFEYAGVSNCVVFSEITENNTYYAYSFVFNMIAEISADKVPFLEYRLIDFIDRPVFQRNINDIAEITVECSDWKETFTLEGEGEALIVTRAADSSKPDVQNFRQFYKTLLTQPIEDYIEEGVDTALLDLYATLKVTTRAGNVTEYKFYPYSGTGRKSFCTINGEGEFYVNTDHVKKMINDTVRVIKGETIDSDAKS